MQVADANDGMRRGMQACDGFVVTRRRKENRGVAVGYSSRGKIQEGKASHGGREGERDRRRLQSTENKQNKLVLQSCRPCGIRRRSMRRRPDEVHELVAEITGGNGEMSKGPGAAARRRRER